MRENFFEPFQVPKKKLSKKIFSQSPFFERKHETFDRDINFANNMWPVRNLRRIKSGNYVAMQHLPTRSHKGKSTKTFVRESGR